MADCAKSQLKVRAFTVMELMVAVLVLAVLGSLASVGYQRYRDHAAILVDQTNEKIILAAVKLYAYDTNALPGSLSQLRNNDLERAYALVTKGKRSYTFLAFLQEEAGLMDIAEAAPAVHGMTHLPDRYLGDNPQKVKTCPFGGPVGASYVINDHWAGQPLSQLLNPDPARALYPVVTEDDYRHEGKTTRMQISVSGIVSRDTRTNASGNTGSGYGHHANN